MWDSVRNTRKQKIVTNIFSLFCLMTVILTVSSVLLIIFAFSIVETLKMSHIDYKKRRDANLLWQKRWQFSLKLFLTGNEGDHRRTWFNFLWSIVISNLELNIKPFQRKNSFISLLKLKTKYCGLENSFFSSL